MNKKISGWFPCALAVFTLLSALSGPVAAETASGTGGERKAPVVALPSWSPLIKRVLPAVVNVSSEIPKGALNDGPSGNGGPDDDPNASFYDFLRRYLERRGLSGGLPASPGMKTASDGKVFALGSGFIIDPAGYVVTNFHVVDKASKITVVFQDNSTHVATLVGSDPKIDIALLKISAKHPLPFLEWGDSNAVDVGDWVIAVGNPFGLGGTVTAGIVSGLGRDLQQGPFDDFLQIDAPINRGNSGGPTFDNAGRVIGINSSIYSPTGGSVGIGFAIPSNIAKAIVGRLRTTGHAEHGYLGFGIQQISPALARALRVDPGDPQGLLVCEVQPDGPAAGAGLRTGDIIKIADGHAVRVPQDISRLIVTAKVGDALKVTVDRDGQRRDLVLTVGVAPGGAADGEDAEGAGAGAAAKGQDHSRIMGIWFASLTPDVRRELHVSSDTQGVVIGDVSADSPAGTIGLLPGDLVSSINRQPVSDPADAMEKLGMAGAEGDVLLLVTRRGKSEFVALSRQDETTGSRQDETTGD